MIHIDVEIVKGRLESDWMRWKRWKARADRATQALLEKWTKEGKITTADFKAQVWADLKTLLLDKVFHGKCAYCETHIGQARQSGDADHFRPKGAVNFRKLDDGAYITPKVAGEDGQESAHPGYFWLAYDWQNLLPACRMCNSDEGKKSQFPVSREHVFSIELPAEALASLNDSALADPRSDRRWFLRPRDLDPIEDPQLLHPYFDRPELHLRFEAQGLVFPRKDAQGQESLKGSHSIKVYDLANEDLRVSRQLAQIRAYNRFQTTMGYWIEQGLSPTAAREQAWAAVADVKNGMVAHSASALAFLCEAFPDSNDTNGNA